ncbi:CorA family divalent cation transporter [Thorsellia anophelis]|uniref:Zinc transporter n=1 Tax=Thorsellia anophelis DSM 18579 TaxID=1123402 RepID=A0A1I0EDD8_9GAMM|nr:CorA family divalent cation transporter [Thorsellia anophelis]SET42960.1 zinc transporter [Thorsellia anophelis DSM 18579]
MLNKPIVAFNLSNSEYIKQVTSVHDVNEMLKSKKIPEPVWININANRYKIGKSEITKQLDFLNAAQKNFLASNCDKSKLIRFTDGLVIYLKYHTVSTSQKQEDPKIDRYVLIRILIKKTMIISLTEFEGDNQSFSDFNLESAMFDDLQRIIVEDDQDIEVGDWLITLLKSLTDRFSQDINYLHDQILDIENKLLESNLHDRTELILIRKQLTLTRRYLVPITELVFRLATEKLSWLEGDHHKHLHEQSEALRRELEEIDLCISRTAIISEELNNLLSDSMNKRLYVMSIITVIFMPATLITGLFGINLGGIPGADSAIAFAIFSIALILLLIFIVLILKRKRWF